MKALKNCYFLFSGWFFLSLILSKNIFTIIKVNKLKYWFFRSRLTVIGIIVFPLSSFAQLNIVDLDSGLITPQQVVDTLFEPGSGADVSNVVIVGDSRCVGTFTGGSGLGDGVLGFDAGVIISSGQVVDAVGPNSSDETSGEFFRPGDLFLDSLIPGETTLDACVIEFDFQCPLAETVMVDYVMGSEEYNEFVGTGANDVFGFALNGTNISTIPGSGGVAVSIANLNCGNPYDPFSPVSPNAPFCDLFINNDPQDGGGNINIEADGLTTVLTAEGDLLPGINHMKFAVGDVLDEAFDTWVYLKAGSFRCDAPMGPGEQLKTLLSASCTTYQNNNVFANEDVIEYDEDTGLFSKLFDGSDVGLAYSNVDAFSMSASGDLLISLHRKFNVPGLGYIGDEDILRFVPSVLGDLTEGTFELLFDGSQHGLGYCGVGIDAFHIDEGVTIGTDDDGDGIPNEQDDCPLDALNDVDGDGLCGNVKLYFSLASSANLGGSWYSDEDIILFEEATGSFSKYFNGSRVGLSHADIDAIRLQSDGSILMSLKCSTTLPEIGAVKDEDIIRFIPTSLGQDTAGTFEIFFDGGESGLMGSYMDFDAVDQILK